MIRLPLLSVLVLCACSICAGQSSGHGIDNQAISRIKESANYDFYNELMYRSPQDWVGKIIAFTGVIADYPVIVRGRDIVQVSGTSGGDYANIVAFLDQPLPEKPLTVADRTATVTRGQRVIIVGRLTPSEEFVNKYGSRFFLPTMDCLMIYNGEDRELSNPLWVSKTLKRP